MNKTMKVCGVLVAVMLAGSVSMAQYRGGNRYEGGGGHGYDSGHYGYYHGSHGEVVFGLLGLGLLAAAVSAQPVYVQPPQVVYQAAPPMVYYVEQPRGVYPEPPVIQQPQVVYVQQPPPAPQPTVVYQTPPAPQPPAQVAPPVVQPPAEVKPAVPADRPPPVMLTINVQNSDGSYTPVTLHQEGALWVGPKGEYYRDGIPTVGQLRPLYGR